MSSLISTETHLLPPLSPTAPSFLLHITRMEASYLLWVGTSSSAHEVRPTSVKVGKEWSVGMPPGLSAGRQAVGTPIFRPSSSDLAMSMSVRLARRFNSQIFLSLDLPPSLTASSASTASGAANPNAQKILLDLEGNIGRVLRAIEAERVQEDEPVVQDEVDKGMAVRISTTGGGVEGR